MVPFSMKVMKIISEHLPPFPIFTRTFILIYNLIYFIIALAVYATNTLEENIRLFYWFPVSFALFCSGLLLLRRYRKNESYRRLERLNNVFSIYLNFDFIIFLCYILYFNILQRNNVLIIFILLLIYQWINYISSRNLIIHSISVRDRIKFIGEISVDSATVIFFCYWSMVIYNFVLNKKTIGYYDNVKAFGYSALFFVLIFLVRTLIMFSSPIKERIQVPNYYKYIQKNKRDKSSEDMLVAFIVEIIIILLIAALCVFVYL